MALGGGNFTLQNKVLPGSYINFVSIKSGASTFLERGVVSMAFLLDWGVENEIFEVTNETFYKNSLEIFGYNYDHENLMSIRELFKNANKLFAYRLNVGEKASCLYGVSKYGGVRGNDLGVCISVNADDDSFFDVTTYIDYSNAIETQTVSSSADLLDNNFIIWDKTAELQPTAYLPLTGGDNFSEVKASNEIAVSLLDGSLGNGTYNIIKKDADNYIFETYDSFNELLNSTNVSDLSTISDNDYVCWNDDIDSTIIENILGGNLESEKLYFVGGVDSSITNNSHQQYLNKAESYSFNAIAVDTTSNVIKNMYASFTKRMRDEMGVKFQLVAYNLPYDYEGVVNVKNSCVETVSSLVYWVCGAIASCEVNKSCLNKIYDGEFNVNTSYTQTELGNFIEEGYFTLHKVGDDIRVLSDVNSLVTISDIKSEIFKDNQTIRVIDQIATDIAFLFNSKYLGVVPNDTAGRISLWSDIIKHHKALQDIRAIENFSDTDVVVLQGDDKKSVIVNDSITITNTMAKLYMSVMIA